MQTNDSTYRLYDTATMGLDTICMDHRWHLESMRGSNRNQRVEHVRCTSCGECRTRVWTGWPNQRKPDRNYQRDPAPHTREDDGGR